ncbi:MAG: hypothetical protein ACI35T_02200 [Alistipes sp.]
MCAKIQNPPLCDIPSGTNAAAGQNIGNRIGAADADAAGAANSVDWACDGTQRKAESIRQMRRAAVNAVKYRGVAEQFFA